jgi:KipI family sensor histidine kinase inhibitor
MLGRRAARNQGLASSLAKTAGGDAMQIVWRSAGDGAVVFEPADTVDTEIDAAVNAHFVAWAEALHAAKVPSVRNVIPAYRSLFVAWDPNRLSGQAVIERVGALRPTGPARVAPIRNVYVVPVWYGGAAGPDLDAVASRLGLEPAQVVHRHTEPVYRIFCLGFAPGFPMAGPLPDALRLPRRDVPRAAVPAGSVALAGNQTGIYPVSTPGGWHLLGRTPVRVFVASADPPVAWAPGDGLKFIAISEEMFQDLDRRGLTLHDCRADARGQPGWQHGIA